MVFSVFTRAFARLRQLVATAFAMGRRRRSKRVASRVDGERWPGASDSDWDRVDEASWESFPASDAPSYTPGQAS